MSDNIVSEALVNRKTGEVVEIGLQKTPAEIMDDAAGAARALEKLIESNKRKPVEFGGKRYLEYPHWQTIAKFYHTTAATGESAFVDINGIKGFKAVGRVYDEKTGLLVGMAEAYCMTDEPNWRNKPLFQLASMAQTRAASKALSNKYRYVAIVAGYEPTPAEEADMITERNLRAPQERLVAEIEMSGPGGGSSDLITEKQRKMLFARSRTKGIPEEDMKQYLWSAFTLEHTKDLTRDQFDLVLKWVDEYKLVGE
jgi:hypothetical protein